MPTTSSQGASQPEGIMGLEAHLATPPWSRAASLVGGLTTALLALALLGPAPARAVPPSIVCPAPITVEADQTGGANVTPGTATASDGDGDVVTITGPPAGVYPLGTTSVTYVATDSSGSTASCSTTITVVDTTAPSITCPASITAEADQTGGANVTPGNASASDIASSVTVSDPPAALFLLGTTSVTHTATDSSGNSSSCTSTITVVDTTAPSITCPSDITAAAGAGGTAVVTYSAQASDIADATPTLTFSPPSGSAFSIGTTNVTATVTDHSGNTSSCGFTVTVQQSLPTAKTQCDNGGWQSFGIFRNQGECVSFVNRKK
jgi:hypothetical protein